MEEVMLEEPNERQRMANERDEAMDEDDEDGRPGVQCAQRE
jgi:DnaJ family protein A protein 2